VGRIGADEFALVGPTDSDYQAAAMAQAVSGLITEPFAVGGAERAFHLTACLGVATSMPHGPIELAALRTYRAATEALHDAKQRGPGTIEWFDEHRHHERAEQFRLVNDLHGAIDRGEFALAYQPIVEMSWVRPIAVEALMRWNHPELGTLLPARFIPLMEAAGLMVEAGDWALRTACEQLITWQQRLNVSDLPAVCVNVSAVQFEQAEFAENVARTLRVTGVEPDHLVLELTEGTLLRDPLRAQAILNELERLGVRVSIDDFGTGHSSLAYLKRLPAHFVKIDRAFVTNIDVDRRDQALVRAALDVTEALGMTAIAEGVETRDQLTELRRLGCELAQGFYWSTPVPAPAIEPWISGRMLSLAPRLDHTDGRAWTAAEDDDAS
jgi:EAL domain-containing protein (putative c-di-GMP-specific phosphodiesterase class I)